MNALDDCSNLTSTKKAHRPVSVLETINLLNLFLIRWSETRVARVSIQRFIVVLALNRPDPTGLRDIVVSFTDFKFRGGTFSLL